jgi:hypothetical protein
VPGGFFGRACIVEIDKAHQNVFVQKVHRPTISIGYGSVDPVVDVT